VVILIQSGIAGCAILLTRALISSDSVTARLNRGWGIPRSGNISVPRDFYVWSDKAKVPQNVPPSSNLAMIFMMVQAINARTFPKLWQMPTEVRSGSTAVLMAPNRDFRFCPNSRLNSDIAVGPFSAINGSWRLICRCRDA
jgi:hypothetical protein